MSLSATLRFTPFAVAIVLAMGLSACGGGLGLGGGLDGIVTNRTEGYAISSDGLAQIRNGQSQDLVQLVLGSPQSTNDFGDESAWYYVQTDVSQTAFGLRTIKDRTVLAIYFDKNKRVKDRAVYALKDGRQVTIETRRTPSYGADKTFVESILSSI